MLLTSPAFDTGRQIPLKFTCQGDNVNPPLVIKDVPLGAHTLALIMDDPDAPSGVWVHWVVWNIPPNVGEIPIGFLPIGSIEGTTSARTTGYRGPCPPSGRHRYFFKLYALDTSLDLPVTTTATALELIVQPQLLVKAELMGTYEKQ